MFDLNSKIKTFEEAQSHVLESLTRIERLLGIVAITNFMQTVAVLPSEYITKFQKDLDKVAEGIAGLVLK